MHGVLRNECVSGRAHVRGSGRGYQRESEGVYENEELERVFESAAGFEGGARPSAAWGAAHTARMAEAVLVAALGESAEDAGDTIEYIVGMLEDEDAEVEDLLEAMVPMLEMPAPRAPRAGRWWARRCSGGRESASESAASTGRVGCASA